MKPFIRRSLEVIALGAILITVTSPITYKAIAQAGPIRGEISAGVYENIKTDGSGRLQTTLTGSGGTSSYTFSTVAVTNAGTFSLVNANTSRKALMIQNNSTAYNIYVGTVSPVTATSGFTLVPGASFFVTASVPTNAFYALGTSSVASTTQVGEGQ